MRSRPIASAAALIALVSVVAACGGDDDDAADTTAAAAAATTAAGGSDTTSGAETTSGGSSAGVTGDGGTVKIGVAEMLTGSGAFYGNAVLEGIEVAQQELNDGGGILGMQVELDVQDNASDNAQATSLIKKFAQDSSMGAAIPPTYQPNFNAACAAASAVELPVVSAQSGPPDPENNGGGFCYTMTTDPIPQMQATFQYLADQGLKKLVMVYDQDNGYIAFQRPNLQQAAADGGYELIEIGTPGGTTDFGPQITSAMSEEPDAVFPAFVIEDGARFMQQARAKGLEAPFFDPMSQLTSRRLPELSGGAAVGLLASTPQSPDDIPSFQAFLDQYREMNGADLDDPTYTGFGYDALMLIAKAMTDAGTTTDRAAIKAQLDSYTEECFSICFTNSGSGPFFAGDFYFVELTEDGWVSAS